MRDTTTRSLSAEGLNTMIASCFRVTKTSTDRTTNNSNNHRNNSRHEQQQQQQGGSRHSSAIVVRSSSSSKSRRDDRKRMNDFLKQEEIDVEAEFFQQRYGALQPPPPASMAALGRLEEVRSTTVCEDTCNICCETYDTKTVVAKLPCGHSFHTTCAVSWLMKKCICPTCRYELPTNDPIYEKGRLERMKVRDSILQKTKKTTTKPSAKVLDEALSSWGDLELLCVGVK